MNFTPTATQVEFYLYLQPTTHYKISHLRLIHIYFTWNSAGTGTVIVAILSLTPIKSSSPFVLSCHVGKNHRNPHCKLP